jgi:hypothetical protein
MYPTSDLHGIYLRAKPSVSMCRGTFFHTWARRVLGNEGLIARQLNASEQKKNSNLMENIDILQNYTSVLGKTCTYQYVFTKIIERLLCSKLLVYAILMTVIKVSTSVHRIKWRRLWWPNIPTHSRNEWTGPSHKAEHFLNIVQLGHHPTLHSKIGDDAHVTSSHLKNHWPTHSLLT